MQPTLVILAAGIGRRFGGLKQLEPVGPGGSAIMDYTVYDALRAGFGHVVLVIRRETEAAIRRHVEAGFGRHVGVTYVHQELDVQPGCSRPPASRSKPWGTGHAVLVAGEAIRGPFAVANADDLYGRASLKSLASFLAEPVVQRVPIYAMVGFTISETLPAAGSVSRGICRCDDDGWLVDIEEIPVVWREGDHAHFDDPNGARRTLPGNTLVSMNLWAFTPAVFAELRAGFTAFLESPANETGEFYLPEAIRRAVEGGRARVRVLPATSSWAGITSPDDRVAVASRLHEQVRRGVYPERLWP